MKSRCKIGIVTNAFYRTKILNNILQQNYPEYTDTDSVSKLYSSMFLKHTIHLISSNKDLPMPVVGFKYSFNRNGNGVKLVTFINSVLLKASKVLRDIVFGEIGLDNEVEDIFKTFLVILSDIIYTDHKFTSQKGETFETIYTMFQSIREDALQSGYNDPCNEMIDLFLQTYSMQDLYNMYISQDSIYMTIFTTIKTSLITTLIGEVPYNKKATVDKKYIDDNTQDITLCVLTDDIYKTLISFIKHEGIQPFISDYLEGIYIKCPKLDKSLTLNNTTSIAELILPGGNVKGTDYTNSIAEADYIIFLENRDRIQKSTYSKDMFNSTVRNSNHVNTFFLETTNGQAEDLQDLKELDIVTPLNFNNILSELMSEGSITKCIMSEIPSFLPFRGVKCRIYDKFREPSAMIDNNIQEFINSRTNASETDDNRFVQSIYSNISNKGTRYALPVESIQFGKTYQKVDLNDISNVAELYLKLNDRPGSILNQGHNSNIGLSKLESQSFVTFDDIDNAWNCMSELISSLFNTGKDIDKMKNKFNQSKGIILTNSLIDSVLEDSQSMTYDILQRILVSLKNYNKQDSLELVLSLIDGDPSDSLNDSLENFIFERIVRKLNEKELSCLDQQDAIVLREVLRHNLQRNIKEWIKSFKLDRQARRDWSNRSQTFEPKDLIKYVMKQLSTV